MIPWASLSGFYLKEMSKTGILKYSTDEVNMTQPLINSEILKKSFNVSKLRFLHLKRGSNTQLIGLL